MTDQYYKDWYEEFENNPDLYFTQQILVHAEELQAYVYRRVQNKEETEDITQEALLRAFQRVRNYFSRRDEQRTMVPWPWLKTIADHLIYDRWKKGNLTSCLSRMEDLLSQIVDQDNQPDKAAEESESQKELFYCINSLKGHEKAILYLRYVKCLSHKDIARKLGLREGTARQRVKRAVDRLRQIWHQRQNSGEVDGR